MDSPRKCCRVCLTETEFNVSLFGSYCRKSNMLDKILVCLRLPIEDKETLNTICHRCADSVERYYDFINLVKKAQTKLANSTLYDGETRQANLKVKHDSSELKNIHLNKRLVTSYVREQVFDADYTFSFLESNNEEKKEQKSSSPFFSYFSPPNVSNEPLKVKNKESGIWKTPKQNTRFESQSQRAEVSKHAPERFRREAKSSERPRHHSRDLFESQSQDVDDADPKTLDWKLTPDDNIIKRLREKCFGLSEF